MKGGAALLLGGQVAKERAEATSAHYSLAASLVVSLFGGPVAAAIVSALNMRSARRARREAAWLATTALVALAALLGIAWWAIRAKNQAPSEPRYGTLVLAPLVSVGLAAGSWRRVRESFIGRQGTSFKGLPLWGHGLLIILVSQAVQLLVNVSATRLWR